MCIYCRTDNYRKIYENHYGPIPVDNNGLTFDIHHIDGNHSNNDFSNLIALSIQDHYNVHFSQNDLAACHIMSARIKMSKEEISILSTNRNLRWVKENRHHWSGDRFPKRSEISSRCQRRKIELNEHPFQNPEIQKRIWEINQKLLSDGTSHLKKIHKCPYCFKIGKSAAMFRWHFDRCKLKNTQCNQRED